MGLGLGRMFDRRMPGSADPDSPFATCKAGSHQILKGVKMCPYCEIQALRKQRDDEEAFYDMCPQGHRFLKSEGCQKCQAARERKKADQLLEMERAKFKEMLAQYKQRSERDREMAERHHAEALAKISEKETEIREKMEKEHQESVRKGALKGLVMEYRGLIRDHDASVKGCTQLQVPMNDALTKLKKEMVYKEKWNGIDSDESILRLVLFSPTGHGKSTLANRICGDTSEEGDEILETSDLPEACTKSIVHRVVDWKTDSGDASRVCVIDTPGWDESEEADRMHANNLINYLRGAQFIHALVLVKNHSTRFTQSEAMMIARFQALVGDSMWQHVILVVTHVEGRQARPKRFDEWRKSLMDQLESQYSISRKIRGTHGPRKSIDDIPVIGLSNFDESGKEFDYRNGITRLISHVKKMGQWRFRTIVSPFDELLAEYDGMCRELAHKEGHLRSILENRREIEEVIQGHPEADTACILGFQSRYMFRANHFTREYRELTIDESESAPEMKMDMETMDSSDSSESSMAMRSMKELSEPSKSENDEGKEKEKDEDEDEDEDEDDFEEDMIIIDSPMDLDDDDDDGGGEDEWE